MRDSNGLFELRQTTSVSPCLRVSVLKMTLEKPTLISTHMNEVQTQGIYLPFTA